MKIVYIDGKEEDLGENICHSIYPQTTRFWRRKEIVGKGLFGIGNYKDYEDIAIKEVFNSQIKEIIF